MLGLMIVLLYLLLLSGYLERGTAIQKFCFNKKPEKKTMLVRRETMLIVWQRALSGKNSFDGCIDIREIKGDRYIQALLSLVVKYFHKGAYNRFFSVHGSHLSLCHKEPTKGKGPLGALSLFFMAQESCEALDQ